MEGHTVVEEKGRIWQNYKPDRYFLPNDAVEQDRLDFASYRGCSLMLHMLQDPHTRSAAPDDVLHLAPVKGDPLRVLDIGTGTGSNAQHRLGRQHAPRHGAAQVRAPCDIEVSRKYKDYPAEAGFVDIVEVKFKFFGNDWSETEPERTPDEYSIVLDAEVTRAISDKLLGEGLGLPDEIMKLIVP
ncbi:methyltransferase domain-containing protein [Seiridium cupressi]